MEALGYTSSLLSRAMEPPRSSARFPGLLNPMSTNFGQWDQRRRTTAQESSWDQASWLSRYFLCFVWPILRRGQRQQLTLDNVDRVPRDDRSRLLGTRLQHCYNERVIKTGEASFLKSLYDAYGRSIALVIFLNSLVDVLSAIMQTVALAWIVRDTATYLKLREEAVEEFERNPRLLLGNGGKLLDVRIGQIQTAYLQIVYDSLLLVGFAALDTILNRFADLRSNLIAMRIKTATSRMVYRKLLKLNQAALERTTVGQMVNLLSNDVNKFEDAPRYLGYLLLGPLTGLIVLLILLLGYLGAIPTLALFMVLLFYFLLQAFMSYGFGKTRSRTAKLADERVRLVNEALRSMQIIKMFAWERPIRWLVEAARKRELAAIRTSSFLKVINSALFYVSAPVLLFVALESYVWLGGQLDPELVFLTVGLSQTVAMNLTFLFPLAISYNAEAFISCKRINEFLLLPEQERQQHNYKSSDDCCAKFVVAFNNVTCGWPLANGAHQVIRSLSLKIHPRDLVLVVGRVGSGKSSLLMAILGELPVSRGSIEVFGRISYASQDAWIYSSSVRDNILFGRDFDPKRYKEVLRVCSLECDMDNLVDGDSTIVGERGVSLSGGQKARVNLARALYTEADIYLLDDPLAAVDAPVARHIFNECLKTFLRKKTVVLATHQLQFLKQATKVLVLDRESPAAFGSLQEVMESEAFKAIDYSKDNFDWAGRSETISKSKEDQSQDSTSSSESLVRKKMSPLVVHWEDKPPRAPRGQDAKRNRPAETLTEVAANWGTLLFYLSSALGLFGFLSFLLWLFGISVFRQLSDLFVTYWTDSVQQVGEGNETVRRWLSGLSLGQISTIYGSLILVSVVLAALRTGTFYWAALRASRNIHTKLAQNVLHAPMKFFNFTPAGILLNRFSRDLGYMDDRLPPSFLEIVNLLAGILLSVLLSIFLNYLSLIGFAVLLAGAWLLFRLCARTIRKLKQIESIQRSPIYSLVSTTAAGLATVRAFRGQDNLVKTFDERQDAHSSAWFSHICVTRWLLLYIDYFKLLYVVTLVVIVLLSLDSLSPSTLGLLLTLITSLPKPLQYSIMRLVEFQSQLTSVQRLKEFCELEPEELPSSGSKEDFVIESGEIKFTDVQLSYFPDEPPVLKGINFTFKAGEKVGVVGRTGAGKSSIVSVLFRLYDYEGLVEIDGVDTKQIPLEQLRRSLSIIPQDPILFNGTIRKNLDPFDEYQDEEMWAALEAVQLKQLVANSSDQLDYKVSEGGSNFSVGQRQLICLARAILRKNKVLVLDEATANVDPETDGFIQTTIGRRFAHCTVITIAHRLITIAGAHRVLVLDQGQVREFGKPSELLDKDSSCFARMVSSSQQAELVRRKIIEAEAS